MSYQNNDNIPSSDSYKKPNTPDYCPSTEVSLSFPEYQSMLGHYFIGQTPYLATPNNQSLVALTNPFNSYRMIYVNAITITNNSALPISADFYLNGSLFNASRSELVTATNTSFCPMPRAHAQILYSSETGAIPTNGLQMFTRIVPPYSTLVVDGSQIILAPRQTLTIGLGSVLPITTNTAKVAFGWVEDFLPFCEAPCNCNNDCDDSCDHNCDHCCNDKDDDNCDNKRSDSNKQAPKPPKPSKKDS